MDIHLAPVNQQPRRFVDRDQVRIAVEDVQHVGASGVWGAGVMNVECVPVPGRNDDCIIGNIA